MFKGLAIEPFLLPKSIIFCILRSLLMVVVAMERSYLNSFKSFKNGKAIT